MFLDLFDVKVITKTFANEEGNDNLHAVGKTRLDTFQKDRCEAAKEQMNVEAACSYLLRRDDGVDFRIAWRILREMMADEEYKEQVLSVLYRSSDVWW